MQLDKKCDALIFQDQLDCRKAGRVMQLDKLELISTPDYSGYTATNLGDVLSPLEMKSFMDWFKGSTGVFHEGQPLVYKHDFDRWSAGLPNND